LKEWISVWQIKLNDIGKFVKIFGTYWNVPEGCVSVLLENINGCSLQVIIFIYFLINQNILETVGTIPEKAIKQISVQTLSSLRKVFENT